MKYMEGLEWVVNHSQSNSIDVNWHFCILDGNRLPLELLGRWDAKFCGIWNVFSFVSFPVGSGSIIYSSKTCAAVLQTHAGNCRNQFKDFDSASRWLRWIYIYISLKFHIYVTIYSIICTTSQPFHEMSPIITMAAKERVKEQITEQIALENLLESQGGVQVPRMPGISEMFLLVKCRLKGCEM